MRSAKPGNHLKATSMKMPMLRVTSDVLKTTVKERPQTIKVGCVRILKLFYLAYKVYYGTWLVFSLI